MRLRYLAVDYFHEASRSSREEHLRQALPVPTVSSFKELDVSRKSDGVGYSYHRSFFDSFSPKNFQVELPPDFGWFEDTTVCDKFLSEIFPAKVPCQPSINLAEGVISRLETTVHWLSSDMEQIELGIKLQVRQDDNRISSGSQTVHTSETLDVAPQSIISGKVPHLSRSGQSTFGWLVKEQKPGSLVSAFMSIEPPQLELQECIIPQKDFWKIILGLGGAQAPSAVEPNEQVALPKVHVPKALFDILPLPCSSDRWKNESSAGEARFSHIDELRRIDEACRSQPSPDEIHDLIGKITPIEIRMILGNLSWKNRVQSELTYPLNPRCLLQWFESHEAKAEKGAHNLPIGGFNTKMPFEESPASKPVYHESEYTQLENIDLLCDHCGPQPSCSMSIMDSGIDPPHDSKLIFEIPRTCDWSMSSSANTTTSIIIAHESETQLPDLPRLHPSQSFESAVVIPELSLDDKEFQFLPVPVVTCPQDYMMDATFGRLVSLKCEPCTVPATDWLYLDWHFFHGLKCTNAACFSLQAQLIKEYQCQSRPSNLLTVEGSKFSLELSLLENIEHSSAFCPGTTGGRIEALLCFPPGEHSQARGEESYQVSIEIQKPRERENKSLLPLPCQDFLPDIDRIAENGFLPACDASNLTQNHHTTGVEAGNVDPEVQATKFNTDLGKMRRPNLPNLQPVERVRTSPSTLKVKRKGQEGQQSIDPGLRRDVRSRSLQSGSGFMANDFDYFVRARKGIPVTGSDLQITEECQKSSSKIVHKPALTTIPGLDDEDHNTKAAAFCEHAVEISTEIRKCMVSLSSDYSALLAMEEISEFKDFKTAGDVETLKQFGFDAETNSYLTSLISNMTDEPVSRQRQMVLRGLIALHVLRHTALNLCSYGIQVGHLYLENCFEKMQFLEGYLMSSRTELEEAYDQVESGMVEDHPKLSYLDKLVGPVALEIHRAKYLSTKILLLADRRAFFTLVGKLVALGLTPYQIDRKENYLHNGMLQDDCLNKLKDEISEALTFSDCLLVSYPYVNSSFPVQQFTMIIQYADSPNMTAAITSWTKGNYVVHFLKVLVHPEEFRMTCSRSSQKQTECQEQNLSGSTRLFKPNTALVPSAEKSLSESSTLNQNVPPNERERITHSSSGGATEQIVENCSSERSCEMIIVANISHPNDHKLTGRRSSYQKILHLEKENLQVVERELRLPVDLILSPASCIVVYTLGKLNLEAQNLKDKQETLQNDVLTHLKAISFSFRDCIMIFEGPTEFTTAALEIYTQMYTLAIAVDIQFQCFASRHPDVTDTILMHFIQAVRRSKRMPSYPIMTEGPTLAEVFLTGFPSINPLTAHAILSSGCPLPVFISYSPEEQYAAIESYEVPKHCLELFKAQCTFKAIPTTAMSNREGVEAQKNQDDVGIRYRHPADSPVVCADVPNQASRPECWTTFPEFPPASAISAEYPTYKAHDINPISFPDFPPVSEISRQAEDPEEKDPSSSFTLKLPTGPNGIDEFPPFGPDWIENYPSVDEETYSNSRLRQSWRPQATLKMSSLDRFIDEFPPGSPEWIEDCPSVHEETNLNSRIRQSRSKGPQAPLKLSSLDRFRYQSKSPAPPTVSKGFTQTTMKFPTRNFPRTAPRRSRTQPPSVTSLPPKIAGKPTIAKKTFTELAAERRPRAILGVARRGSDTQQCLVWKTDPSSSSLKRQKIS